MTDNKMPVEQVDRDAVQGFHREMIDKLMADVWSGKPSTFGDDSGQDEDSIHQAFARHRTAATAPLKARIAELEEALHKPWTTIAASAPAKPSPRGSKMDDRSATTLADRIEASKGPSRELDAEIWCEINGKEFPQPPYETIQPDYDADPRGEALFLGISRSGLLLQSYKDSTHPYTRSLDAAMTLVPEGWMQFDVDATAPELGVDWRLYRMKDEVTACAATPALALCAAALRARTTTGRDG